MHDSFLGHVILVTLSCIDPEAHPHFDEGVGSAEGSSRALLRSSAHVHDSLHHAGLESFVPENQEFDPQAVERVFISTRAHLNCCARVL